MCVFSSRGRLERHVPYVSLFFPPLPLPSCTQTQTHAHGRENGTFVHIQIYIYIMCLLHLRLSPISSFLSLCVSLCGWACVCLCVRPLTTTPSFTLTVPASPHPSLPPLVLRVSSPSCIPQLFLSCPLISPRQRSHRFFFRSPNTRSPQPCVCVLNVNIHIYIYA